MPPTTKPRSSTPRAGHNTNTPPISYSRRTSVLLSPPDHSRKPSISSSMHWLSRSNPQQSTRVSEPRLIRSNIESLGSGATVVATPDEALRDTGVRLTYDGKADILQEMPKRRASVATQKSLPPALLPSPATSLSDLEPSSPPLPSLPEADTESELAFKQQQQQRTSPPPPPQPIRALPSLPSTSRRSSLKPRPVQVEEAVTVPSLPSHISTTPTPPPFRPILVSEVPNGSIDPTKIIVTLETCTASHKTTLETLKSRSSHLSEYLSSLFPSKRASSASSLYSNASDDVSAYRHHLTSQGFLPQSSFTVHLFLDRPSTPYAHILNYLRSPVGSQEGPETLPRSVQMLSSHQRLESLLELRDEAAYLGLEDLRKICVDEIRLRHGPRLHSRGHSTSTTTHSVQASVYSMHALLESVEAESPSSSRDSRLSNAAVDMSISRSLPTPQSLKESSHRRSGEIRSTASSPPAGWI